MPDLEDPKHQRTPCLTNPPERSAPYWLFFSLLLTISCLPVWLNRYPPLWDYPNHVARAYILHNYDTIEAYRKTFYVSAVPIPNLGVDLFFLIALRLVNVYIASYLFLTFTIVLFFVGCHLLGHVLARGRTNWTTLLCSSFVYNSAFLWGFVNYIAGLGLFLISFAFWLRASSQWTRVRLSIASILVFFSYLAHLSAYLFLLIALVTLSLRDIAQRRRLESRMLVGLIPLLPPLLTFLLYMPRGGDVGVGGAGVILRANVGHKLASALAVVTSYNYLFDGLVLAVLFGAGFIVWMAKGAKVHIQSPAFLCGVVLFILFLASPEHLLTGGSVDSRFVLPALTITLLSLRFDKVKLLGRLAFALCVAAMFSRILFIGYEWKRTQPIIEANVRMLQHFPDEATVYPIVSDEYHSGAGDLHDMFHRASRDALDPAKGGKITQAALHNLVLYGVISRHIVLPNVYAYSTQNPLVYRSPVQYRWDAQNIDDRVFAHFNFIWACNIPRSLNVYLLGHTDPVAHSELCTVFRVIRSSARPLPLEGRFDGGKSLFGPSHLLQ